MAENETTAINDYEIREAADKLGEFIAVEVGKLADRILGRPEIGSPEWLAEEDPTRDRTERVARIREWHLVKLRICRQAGVSMTGSVINAKRYGATWADIGEAAEITRQGAFDRWSKFTTTQEDDAR